MGKSPYSSPSPPGLAHWKVSSIYVCDSHRTRSVFLKVSSIFVQGCLCTCASLVFSKFQAFPCQFEISWQNLQVFSVTDAWRRGKLWVLKQSNAPSRRGSCSALSLCIPLHRKCLGNRSFWNPYHLFKMQALSVPPIFSDFSPCCLFSALSLGNLFMLCVHVPAHVCALCVFPSPALLLYPQVTLNPHF